MDRRLFVMVALGGMAGASPVQGQDLGKILGAVAGGQRGLGLPSGLSSRDAEGGLREALSNGAVSAVLKVGRVDGYWRDGKIRIPLPGVLGKSQKTLGKLGLSGPLDDLQQRVNRAAETAAPQARDLFVGAIRSMTVEDVAGVLRGGDTAGTAYLKSRTGPKLTTLFRPPMAGALGSSGALRSLDQVVSRNGLGGAMGQSPSDTLTDFSVEKALDGLFFYVGEEERAIRTNPAKRTSTLLRKTFGAL